MWWWWDDDDDDEEEDDDDDDDCSLLVSSLFAVLFMLHNLNTLYKSTHNCRKDFLSKITVVVVIRGDDNSLQFLYSIVCQ